MSEQRRIELMSCGGGRQSAGIAALIEVGRLSPPDFACMVKLESEVKSVWPYVERYIMPVFERRGVPFAVIDRAKYATVDLWGGEDGKSLLLPAYTDKSGQMSKLPEWCSNEWKRRVAIRWAGEQPGWKERGVNCWIGITHDEKHRRRAPVRQWFQPSYPLLDVLPMHVSGCLAAVEEVGWPEPSRSRCSWCPNQADSEWAELTPEEWERACALDEEIRKTDPHAFLHKSLMPLRQVTLQPKAEDGLFGGCQSGMCY